MIKVFATAALTVVGLVSSAAADGYSRGKRAYAPQPFTWSGCYLGGFVGGAWGGDVSATEAVSQGGAFPAGTLYNSPFGAAYSYDLDHSFIGGGTVGCNIHAAGSPLLFGIEGEVGSMRLHGSVIDPNSVVLYNSDTRDQTRIGNWYGLIAARAGVTFDRTLIYAKGGIAFVDVDARILDNCTTGGCGAGTLNATGSGKAGVSWVIGGGIEQALSNNWSLKAEYLYINQDDFQVCGAGGGSATGSAFCSNHDVDGIHTVKLGLNYRFNSDRYVPLK